MTIEKEARDLIIWMYDLEKDYEFGEGRYQTLYKKVCKLIGKALKKKQDRIEELERSCGLLGLEKNACERKIKELEKEILNLKYVSHTSRDFMKLIDQDKNLKKIAELEHLLHDHSDEVLRTCYQKIKTLESALKEIAKDEYYSEDCLHAKLAKKAIGYEA